MRMQLTAVPPRARIPTQVLRVVDVDCNIGEAQIAGAGSAEDVLEYAFCEGVGGGGEVV